MNTRYKGNTIFKNGSELTDLVCAELNWNYQNAVVTMKKGNILYCKGIALKSSTGEAKSFRTIDGKIINGLHCKIVNYK